MANPRKPVVSLEHLEGCLSYPLSPNESCIKIRELTRHPRREIKWGASICIFSRRDYAGLGFLLALQPLPFFPLESPLSVLLVSFPSWPWGSLFTSFYVNPYVITLGSIRILKRRLRGKNPWPANLSTKVQISRPTQSQVQWHVCNHSYGGAGDAPELRDQMVWCMQWSTIREHVLSKMEGKDRHLLSPLTCLVLPAMHDRSHTRGHAKAHTSSSFSSCPYTYREVENADGANIYLS